MELKRNFNPVNIFFLNGMSYIRLGLAYDIKCNFVGVYTLISSILMFCVFHEMRAKWFVVSLLLLLVFVSNRITRVVREIR
jgi:hypothetical protein